TTPGRAAKDVPAAMADVARELVDEGHSVVCVVANTVARARAVHDLLRPAADAWLLTGRIRELDRERLLAERLERVSVARAREGGVARTSAVAARTVERGRNSDPA